MIVAGPDGSSRPVPEVQHQVEGLTPGDDYAMMRSAATALQAAVDAAGGSDGAKPKPTMIRFRKPTSSSSTEAAVSSRGQGDSRALDDRGRAAAVAKGPDRDAGRETLFMPDASRSSSRRAIPVLYFNSALRDEAHRS